MAILPSDAPGDDPLEVLNAWYEDAVGRGESMPDSMTLATASRDGLPSARVVLFKGIKRGGIFFVTNYQSRKARELEQNPRAALVMHFPLSQRQVRLEGRVQRATAAESDEYFASRPRASQLSAWASAQSQLLTSREELLAQSQQIAARFTDSIVPRPDFWGGYLVFPQSVELWLGRPDRLHDRFLYRRDAAHETWSIERLSP
ncbi:MAG TPA: pyridoxamine 5'-phosphate oxidase [Polyangiaceae bacterium]|nr:pyridoxamine 5'-phosphate oxidase [Polyangiaceae bacterium]